MENLGIFGKSRLREVAGQDGCTPIYIDKNFAIWTFGDTILGDWKGEVTVSAIFEESASSRGMISNSIAFTEFPDDENILRLNFSFLKRNGRVASVLNPGNGSERGEFKIWTIDGIKINRRVYLFYIIVRLVKTGGGEPFSVHGTGLAEWEIPDGWKTGDEVNFRKIGRLFSGVEPVFGDSVIHRGGYLYMIGHRNVKGRLNAYFARVKPGEIAVRKSYMFLRRDGSWTRDIKEAHGYFGEVYGEPSLSYNSRLKKYVVFYCGAGGRIKTAVFRDFAELADIKPGTIYVPEKLPEIKTRALYMYYSGKEIFYTENYIYAVYMNPAIYQPILLRIPYGVMK